jgi:hypothetical protein
VGVPLPVASQYTKVNAVAGSNKVRFQASQHESSDSSSDTSDQSSDDEMELEVQQTPSVATSVSELPVEQLNPPVIIPNSVDSTTQLVSTCNVTVCTTTVVKSSQPSKPAVHIPVDRTKEMEVSEAVFAIDSHLINLLCNSFHSFIR